MKKYISFIFIFACFFLINARSQSERNCHHLGCKYNLQKKLQQTSVIDTSGFDVSKYKLEIEVNPDINSFSGTTTAYFVANENLNSIVLDADSNLTITQVVSENQNITDYEQSNNRLYIKLPTPVSRGQYGEISVSYSGAESQSSGYYKQNKNNTPGIYTKSEPFDAHTWWVCKDNLLDKADTIDIFITHPSKYKAVSNGVLESEIQVDSLFSVSHWSHKYPIPTYLVGVAVTDYKIYTNYVTIDETHMPIINYIYPKDYDNAISLLDNVPEYFHIFNSYYGDYPYLNEKYGHAQWEWGGGLEHATVSFVKLFREDLLAHELMHQWFGDKVTCATWNDIWLNEGFATYGEGLIVEALRGREAFKQWKENEILIITQQTGGSVYNYEESNENRIFDSRLTYSKGAMVVNMLRYKLGDDLFFMAMQNFLNDPRWAYGFATTENLKESLNEFTGINFTEFFNDWVYGEGHPIFNFSIQQKEDKNVSLVVNQQTSHSSVNFFETPFEIEFFGDNDVSLIQRFDLEHNKQLFEFLLPFKIKWARFDPHRNIIVGSSDITLNNLEIVSNYYKNISVYPNPATEYITISAPARINNVKIYNSLGKVVLQDFTITEHKQNIDVSTLATGSYIITVELEDGQTTHKKILKN